MNTQQLKGMYQKGYRYYVIPTSGKFEPLCTKSLGNFAEVLRTCKHYKHERFTVQSIQPDGELKGWKRNVIVLRHDMYVGEEGKDYDRGDEKCVVRIDEHEAGVRIILGLGENRPDLFIERQRDKWIVVVHPEDGADPFGAIEFEDQGGVFYQRECCIGGDVRIEMTREFPE